MTRTATAEQRAESAPQIVRESAEPAPPASGGRKRVVLAIVGLVLLVGLVVAGRKLLYARAHESTDNAQVDGHIVPVIAKVGGYVEAVNVVENQPVKEGQVLVTLDTRELQVRLAQAEADLAAAAASAGGSGQAEAQVRTLESQTAAGQAQVAAARAALTKAEGDYRRAQALAAEQIVSQQNLEAARTTVDVARAQLAAVERQAAASGAGVSGAQAGVRLADARLAAARAARDNAKLQLSYAQIAAPLSGVATKKTVEPGQLVQPGQTLLSVVADTGVWVTANFKETQLADLRAGQPVELDVDAYGGAKAEGVVESIGAASGAKFALLPPDNATGNFTKVVQRVPVRIRVVKGLGRERPLRPGMSVEAHVATR
ncbi:MAG: HlyD family secretion protein [Gemmatimonadaceae bacterium]